MLNRDKFFMNSLQIPCNLNKEKLYFKVILNENWNHFHIHTYLTQLMFI